MINMVFSERQREILSNLRDKGAGERRERFERALDNVMEIKDIEDLCLAINDEYLMFGINENYSTNEYGRELENILNIVNRPRLGFR